MGQAHPSRMYFFFCFSLVLYISFFFFTLEVVRGEGDTGYLTITAQAGSRSEAGIP